MIASGIVTYGFKTYLGEWAEDKIHSRLGARANLAIIFIYFGMFFSCQHFINAKTYLNINQFANMRTLDGEVLTGIIASHYPDRIYSDRF